MRSDGFTYQNKGPNKAENLRLDGYYYNVVSDTSITFKGAKISPLILWRNGSAVSFIGSFGNLIRNDPPIVKYGDLEEARRIFESKLEKGLSRTKGRGRGRSRWGKFRIIHDSISIKIMNVYPYWGYIFQYIPVSYRGVISNDTTFILTERTVHRGPYEGVYGLDQTYHFCPLGKVEKPSSKNWTQTHSELQ